MTTFREKWFWALCLAILVHVGVFFIFYLNANKTESIEITSSAMDKNIPSAVSPLVPPINDKVYTTSINSIKTPSETDTKRSKDDKLTSNDQQRSALESDNKAYGKVLNNIDDKLTISAPVPTPSLASKANVQSNSYPENTAGERLQTNETLEELKNNAGLLDIDVPTRKSTVKVDKDYLSAKSEVEEINNQLSVAINEVKKRNQQKIKDRQQPRNETTINTENFE